MQPLGPLAAEDLDRRRVDGLHQPGGAVRQPTAEVVHPARTAAVDRGVGDVGDRFRVDGAEKEPAVLLRRTADLADEELQGACVLALRAQPGPVDALDGVALALGGHLLDLQSASQGPGDLVAQLHEPGAAQGEFGQAYGPGGADLVDGETASGVPLGVVRLQLHAHHPQPLVPGVRAEGVHERVVGLVGGERTAELHQIPPGPPVQHDTFRAGQGEDLLVVVHGEKGAGIFRLCPVLDGVQKYFGHKKSRADTD